MPEPTPVFLPRDLLRWLMIFVITLWTAHHLVLFTYRFVDFDCPPHWPLSIYNPRGPHGVLVFCALAASVLVGALALWRLPRKAYPLGEVVAFGLLLILLTNGIQGVPKGYVNPISGGISGEQYYHDSLRITSPSAFLHDFARLQPALRTHARTHPPGAVLLFWWLNRCAGLPPAAIAIVIAVVSALLSAGTYPRLTDALLPAQTASGGYATFLLLLLPAVQIYYCATLDAVVASLLLAAAAGACLKPPTPAALFFTAAALIAASFLTFGFVWIFPVLTIFYRARSSWSHALTRVGLLLGCLVLFYGLLDAVFGFDYLTALRTASHLENPDGFRLLAEPISYFFTRWEDISELLVFFGPFLIGLCWRGLRRLESPAQSVFWTAVGTLLFLFLTGAYHTGETARACIFLYPYLLLPVLVALRNADERERVILAALVLIQTIAMQTWGNFFW